MRIYSCNQHNCTGQMLSFMEIFPLSTIHFNACVFQIFFDYFWDIYMIYCKLRMNTTLDTGWRQTRLKPVTWNNQKHSGMSTCVLLCLQHQLHMPIPVGSVGKDFKTLVVKRWNVYHNHRHLISWSMPMITNIGVQYIWYLWFWDWCCLREHTWHYIVSFSSIEHLCTILKSRNQ